MPTKKVKYTQPLFGEANALGYLILVPGASVLIRQDGVACDVFADNDGMAMTNPVPTGVPTGTAGVDVNGTLLVYLDPGRGYDGLATVGAAVSTFPIPDISPDVEDVQAPIPPGTYVPTATYTAGLAEKAPLRRLDPTSAIYAGGMRFDGNTDDTAALNAVLAAAYTANGAVIECPQTGFLSRINGRIVIPSAPPGVDVVPNQPPIIFTSAGAPDQRGRTRTGAPPYGGGLDLRYAGRTETCGTTNASAVITDAAITAADLGAFVYGAGVVDLAQVVAVTPGVSFVVTIPNTPKATLTTPIVSGATVTSLAVAALPGAFASGAQILIGEGATYQVVTASAPAAQGATSISVTSFVANAAYAAGASVVNLTEGACTATASVSLNVAHAKITSLGNGYLEFDRLTLADNGTSKNPFGLSTATVVNLHDCSFYGNPSKTGATCDQDVWVFGGVMSTASATPSSPYQGYGCRVRDNHFYRIRRIYCQTYTADLDIDHNQWWQDCGTGLALGACFESYGTPGQSNNVSFTKNRCEMNTGYKYTTRCAYTATSLFAFNDLQDAHASNVAAHRFESTAPFNLVILGQIANPAQLGLDDQTAGTQTVIDPRQSQKSKFPQGLDFSGSLTTVGTFAPAMVDATVPPNTWQQDMSAAQNIWRLRYTPSGGAADVVLQAARNSSAAHIFTFGGSSSATLKTAGLELLLQSAAGSALKLGDPTLPADTKITNGVLQLTHAIAFAGTCTVAAASGSTGVAVSGKDMAMKVTLTTAAGIAADASVATVTFGKAWQAQAPGSVPRFGLTPKNGDSVAAGAFITGDTHTGFSIALHTPPAGATALAYDLVILGS